MITVIFTILSALYDNGKRFQDHSDRFIMRGIFILFISIVEVPNILVGDMLPTACNYLLNLSLFYAIFDYLLNILEKRKWNYIGQTSKIDQFWNNVGGWIPQLIFKIGLLLLTFKLK